MRFAPLALVLAAFLSLGGCVPMAMFAQGGYGGYHTSFGTYVASPEVNAFCITPRLRLAIWSFEGAFGRRIVMTSGYRDLAHNAAAGRFELIRR